MSESFNQKGNLIEIEAECEKLNHLILNYNSNRLLLVALTDFYEKLLQTKQTIIIDAYISQYINEYKNCLSSYDPFYISPITTEKIIESAKHIFTSLNENVAKDFITNQINRIESKLGELNKVLMGNDSKEFKALCFPVLEQEILQSKETFGLLESLTVQIRKAKNETKFLVIPSELHLEQKIQKQIDISWRNAIDFLKENKIKIPGKNYEILIAFDLKEGTIIGNSLGVVLTIYFIEELLKFYDSSLILKPRDNIVITGGLDYSGKIISTSTEIIRIKTEIVFYSAAKTFCVPKVNEIKANERLFELKQRYPNRNLEIIGLTDLDDLLNRRNVVDVHKKNLIQIVVTIILRKWKSILLAMILTIVFSFLFVLDFDDNPAMFEQNGRILSIKNKNGKTLWNTKMSFDPLDGIDQSSICRMFVDINNDGINEVLISEEDISPLQSNYGRVACFDNTQNLIWEYNFRDTVSTFRLWNNTYHISIFDTITLNKTKILLCGTRNIPNFPSAVFKLDIKTGKRIDSVNTLWNAGTFNNGIVGDFNEDGTKELILGGLHNGFQSAIIVSVDVNKISGQTPTPERYYFNNIKNAELNQFILLPHTDYGRLFARMNSVPHQHLYFSKHSNEFEIATKEGDLPPILIYYGFDKYLNFLWVDCADNAQIHRDSLVIKGILQKPYTNTNEYFEILRKQIEYWDGEKFVNIDDRKK